MSYRKPEKRIIVQQPTKIKPSEVTVLPPVEGLLAEALNIISAELNKYNLKVKQGRSLDLSEARVVQGYLKSLVEISRESRERDKGDDLKDLTDEQLLELARKHVQTKKPSGQADG